MGGGSSRNPEPAAPLFPLYAAIAAVRPARLEYAAAAWVLAAAVAVRFYALGVPALNLDEALVAVASVHDAGYIFQRALQTDAHPPFFYYLAKLLLLFGNSDFALRTLPCLCGAGAVYALYALGRRWFGAGTALLASALMAVNLLHVQVSRSFRPHAIIVLLATLSFFFFLDYLRAPSRRTLARAALVNAGMLLLHFNALLAVGAQGLFYLILLGLRKKRPDRDFWLWTGLAALGAAPGAIFLTLRLGQFSGFNMNTSMLWTVNRTYDNLSEMFAFFPGPVFAIIGTALFVAGLAVAARRDRMLALAGLTAFAGPLLALIAVKYGIFYSPWHIAFILPVMFLYSCYALAPLLENSAVRATAAVAVSTAGAAFLFSARADALYALNSGLVTPPPSKTLARLLPESEERTQFVFQKVDLPVFTNWYLRLNSGLDLTRNAILPDDRTARVAFVVPEGLFAEFSKDPGIEAIRRDMLSSLGPEARRLAGGGLDLPVWELDRTVGVRGVALENPSFEKKFTAHPSSFFREVRSLRDVMVGLSPLTCLAYPAGFDRPGRIEYAFVNRTAETPLNIRATAKLASQNPGNEAVFTLRFDDEPELRARHVFTQTQSASLTIPVKRDKPFARLAATIEMTATGRSPTFYSDSATIGFESLVLEAYQEPEPFRSDPFVEKAGISSVEESEERPFVWGSGPQSELRFQAEKAGPMRLEVAFTNPIPNQTVEMLANGNIVKTFANVPPQKWLAEESRAEVPFMANAGENVVVLRYVRWNANPADPGATFAPGDGRPMAAAFTRLRLRNAPPDEAHSP